MGVHGRAARRGRLRLRRDARAPEPRGRRRARARSRRVPERVSSVGRVRRDARAAERRRRREPRPASRPALSPRDALLLESFAVRHGVVEPPRHRRGAGRAALDGRRRFGTRVFAVATGCDGDGAALAAVRLVVGRRVRTRRVRLGRDRLQRRQQRDALGPAARRRGDTAPGGVCRRPDRPVRAPGIGATTAGTIVVDDGGCGRPARLEMKGRSDAGAD